jgi:hypothetical protein
MKVKEKRMMQLRKEIKTTVLRQKRPFKQFVTLLTIPPLDLRLFVTVDVFEYLLLRVTSGDTF